MDPILYWVAAGIGVFMVFKYVAKWADKLEAQEREQLEQRIREELRQEQQQQQQQYYEQQQR